MQRYFPLLSATFFLLALSFGAQATTWTVSNDPNKPAQFTSAQAAADAAAAGDTLLISGSTTSYGNLDIEKQLHLIGEGWGPSVDIPTFSTIYCSNQDAMVNASGSVIEGLNINQLFFSYFESGTLENVVVKRCSMEYASFQPSAPYDVRNIRIEDSRILRYAQFTQSHWLGNSGNVEDIEFLRCVFDGIDNYHLSGVGDCNGHLFIRNCMFLTTGGKLSSGAMSEATFENCIFIGGNFTDVADCVFNHCLAHQGDDALPPTGNAGSGNLSSTDPQFASYPMTPTDFSWDHDYTLAAGSPAIDAGAQGAGMDLGIGGNLTSFDGNLPETPRGPVVTEVNLPVTAVTVGGTLQINVSAESRD